MDIITQYIEYNYATYYRDIDCLHPFLPDLRSMQKFCDDYTKYVVVTDLVPGEVGPSRQLLDPHTPHTDCLPISALLGGLQLNGRLRLSSLAPTNNKIVYAVPTNAKSVA